MIRYIYSINIRRGVSVIEKRLYTAGMVSVQSEGISSLKDAYESSSFPD